MQRRCRGGGGRRTALSEETRVLVCVCVVCVVCVWVQNGKLVETIEGPNTPALERAIYLHTPANPDMDDLEVRVCVCPLLVCSPPIASVSL